MIDLSRCFLNVSVKSLSELFFKHRTFKNIFNVVHLCFPSMTVKIESLFEAVSCCFKITEPKK